MPGPWYTSVWFRVLAIGVGAVFILGFGVDAIFHRDNDFEWHRDAGRSFLQANDETLHAEWYPLGRRMLDASLNFVPYRMSRAIVLCLALSCFALAIRLWQRMANRYQRLDAATTFAAVTLSLAFMAPHLSRDFQECGLQLILLSILTAAAYALCSGRAIQAGFWLALAVTYKTTPILFLPVLVWKRRWRAAAATVAFVVVLNLLPALYLGWDLTMRCHLHSWERFQSSARQEDVAENGIEAPAPKNQALMSVFARYLQTYPPGHPLYLDQPAFVQFGHLDLATTRAIAKSCLLLLAGFIAWRMWGRWAEQAVDLPAQWAVVCIFTALLSPLCWRQHLVLAWPASFLLVRYLLARPAPSRLGWALLGVSVFVLWLPQGELLGDLAIVLMSLKLDTFVFLAWALALLYKSRVAAVASQSVAPPVVPMQRMSAA